MTSAAMAATTTMAATMIPIVAPVLSPFDPSLLVVSESDEALPVELEDADADADEIVAMFEYARKYCATRPECVCLRHV